MRIVEEAPPGFRARPEAKPQSGPSAEGRRPATATAVQGSSVFSKVSDYFTDEKLRVAFSFHPLLIGGNPLSATSAPAPVVARSGSNLTLTYDVKTAATAQFSVVAQTSSDLSSWTAAVNGTAGVTITTTPVDVNTNRVVVTVPMSGERLFARLRVTSAP